MDEKFEVVVQQQVGVIQWNFEQLKEALSEKMKEYEGLVYTEDNVKVAKADIATLRKLKKAISDKRIEIKEKCLEPYTLIEAQAKELNELIDKPINQIDVQLTEYEKNRKEAVRKKIQDYFDEIGKELPPDILLKVKELKYKPEWENATTAIKRWKQGVEDKVRAAKRDLDWIDETVEEELREGAIAAYKRNLELQDVMTEVTKARKQKEIILAKERERIAAEERAKAEAEARAKMEAEMKAKEAEKAVAPVQPPIKEEQNTPLNARLGVKSERNGEGLGNVQPATQNTVNEANTNADNSQAEIHTLRIKATASQWAKIKGYIEYCGARYREV